MEALRFHCLYLKVRLHLLAEWAVGLVGRLGGLAAGRDVADEDMLVSALRRQCIAEQS